MISSSNERNASDVYLVDYFIYSPLLCGKEGQEGRKILYYYPETVEIDRQIRRIGYCEGLVQFTETFGFDDPCEAIHFQKTRLLFYQVENDICLAMSLHIPVHERKKEEKIILDYSNEKINDRLILPILKMSYRYFVLQQGLMSVILQHEGIEKLRMILKEHFDTFIQYHLQAMISHVTIDSSLFGVEFLPVERKVYLKIQSILRRLELRFSSLKETFFLYRDQIIWSGLSQYDTTLLFSFFSLYYWPHIKTLSSPSTIRYLTVNTSVNSTDELQISKDLTSQEFYLGNSFTPHRIIVIYLNFFTIFCVFDFDEYLPDNEQFSSIIELLQKDLNIMIWDFEEYSRQKYPTVDPTTKNVYYNKVNMAHATTIDWNREPHNNLIGVMNTLAEDLQWLHSTDEVMVKRENDPWVIAKRSDMRELLITVNQKDANLKEISDKIKQIFSTQFNNIFLLERF